MRIENVRLGFATNSSSTHSVIFLKNPERARDDDVFDQEFSWNYFTAASRNAKRAYLAQLIRTALRDQSGDEVACIVAKEWTGVAPQEDGHVDHQSEVTIPRSFDGKGIDRAFVEDLRAFLDREDVVILGGNDNDVDVHPLASLGPRSAGWDQLWKESERHEIVTRKDGLYWALFDRTTGAKVRMTFDESAPPYAKASRPELVDVKITDFCPFACTYCYEDSTTRGAHASEEWLKSLAYALGDMQVFEVAIGGGEPTLHPDFLEILGSLRRAGAMPSFTTRNLSFIRDPKAASAAAKHVRAFAVSIDGGGHGKPHVGTKLDDIFDAWKNGPLSKAALTLQYVIGTAEDYELRSILERCAKEQTTLLLLGYKTVGRGAEALHLAGQAKETQIERWVDLVKAHTDKAYVRVAIDTALAAQSKARLEAEGVSRCFYSVREGDFSMYVDAVAKKAAPSSFCEPAQYVDLSDRHIYTHDEPSALEEVFRSF